MIYQQSVFEPWPIESESVQSVICSPPYYALRKYSIPDVIIGGDKDCKHEWGNIITKKEDTTGFARNRRGLNRAAEISDGHIRTATTDIPIIKRESCFCIHCNAWKGQYGLESTPQMYVEHTRLWAKEVWRVLRNDGIFFLNLADSYHNPTKWTNKNGAQTIAQGNGRDLATGRKKDCGIPSKCQLLIPHRVAISLVDAGWTLRNTICWFKSNAMPESVTDRFSKKYEYIFMFTKQEKYYFDLDSVREKCPPLNRWGGNKLIAKGQSEWDKGTGQITYRDRDMQPNDGMKNPGDVWQIPTSPSSEKHFAMWPERLVERMVKCSTKAGDIVLDCFAGSATTLKVAEQLHRKGTGIDLGYHEMSKRRTSKIQKELFV